VFAAGLVIPAIVSVPAVLFASAQDAPERVIVAVVPEAVSVAEQLEKPVGRVTVAPEGTVNAEGNVTVIVLPALSFPLEEVVNPTVQVEVALAAVEPAENVTLVGAVAALITTAEDGLVAVVSFEVATLNPLAG